MGANQEKDEIVDNNFGRRTEDRIGISRLFNLMCDIQDEMSQVKQTLNNGIVRRTQENTEAIDNLSCEVQEVKDIMKKKKSFKKGKFNTWHTIKTILASVGSTMVVILTILYYLGVIW